MDYFLLTIPLLELVLIGSHDRLLIDGMIDNCSTVSLGHNLYVKCVFIASINACKHKVVPTKKVQNEYTYRRFAMETRECAALSHHAVFSLLFAKCKC